MSYNITHSDVKVLNNLVIPYNAFFEHSRKDWHPKSSIFVDDSGNSVVTLDCGCEQTITGILKDGQLSVTGLNLSGEGSGTFMNWILEPALEQSTGELEVFLIWEGGDSITTLTVKDGEVYES